MKTIREIFNGKEKYDDEMHMIIMEYQRSCRISAIEDVKELRKKIVTDLNITNYRMEIELNTQCEAIIDYLIRRYELTEEELL